MLTAFLTGALLLASTATISTADVTSLAGSPEPVTQLTRDEQLEGPADLKFFRIGTGGTGGTYFIIGGLLANGISNPPGSRPCNSGGSCGVPNLIAVAQSTAGSMANLAMLKLRVLESAIVQDDLALTNVKKVVPDQPQLRLIAHLYPDTLHVVALADSDIDDLQDLKGKKVALGQDDSGSAASALDLFKALNIPIKPVYGQSYEAADALLNKEVAAFVMIGGYPLPMITSLAESTGIRLLTVEPKNSIPAFAVATIPADLYPGVEETKTLEVKAAWLTTAEQPEDLIYNITKALWQPSIQQLLHQGHPQGRQIVLTKALDGANIPLHAGAAKFYHELGLLK